MKQEELGEFLNQKSEDVLNIRCGNCLRIIFSRELGEFKVYVNPHSCWEGWDEIEINEQEIGGKVGTLLTVIPKDKEKRKTLMMSIYREE